jgi:protein-tyrosine phosphatase
MAWRAAGVNVVVSLLTPDESLSLGLDREVQTCGAAGIKFRSLPIVDPDIPRTAEALLRFLRELGALLRNAKNVLIHCRQAIGRAGLVAVTLLLEKRANVEQAIDLVSTAGLRCLKRRSN